MPLIPTKSEILTRFIYTSSHIRKSDNTVKYAAFLPNYTKDNQTSVYRINGLSESMIWNIASWHVTPNQQSSLKGRVDINSNDVVSNGLEVIPKEPPYRHANIAGWGNDKSKDMLIAIQLADKEKATLHLAVRFT